MTTPDEPRPGGQAPQEPAPAAEVHAAASGQPTAEQPAAPAPPSQAPPPPTAQPGPAQPPPPTAQPGPAQPPPPAAQPGPAQPPPVAQYAAQPVDPFAPIPRPPKSPWIAPQRKGAVIGIAIAAGLALLLAGGVIDRAAFNQDHHPRYVDFRGPGPQFQPGGPRIFPRMPGNGRYRHGPANVPTPTPSPSTS
jgi:hypothetical protein